MKVGGRGTGPAPNPEWKGRSSGPVWPPRARPPLARWVVALLPHPWAVPASTGSVVTQSWSLSRSKPLAEFFDAKNRLFHQKTQRKIHFMSQKELPRGVAFFLGGAWALREGVSDGQDFPGLKGTGRPLGWPGS